VWPEKKRSLVMNLGPYIRLQIGSFNSINPAGAIKRVAPIVIIRARNNKVKANNAVINIFGLLIERKRHKAIALVIRKEIGNETSIAGSLLKTQSFIVCPVHPCI
jgi:hypothetical protein